MNTLNRRATGEGSDLDGAERLLSIWVWSGFQRGNSLGCGHLGAMALALTSGEQAATWFLYSLRQLAHFSCYNLYCWAVMMLVFSTSLLPTFNALSSSLFLLFKGAPTRLPQWSWGPHTPTTDRPHVLIDNDVLTLKTEALDSSVLALEIAVYSLWLKVSKWTLSGGRFVS